ncbi:MAG: flavodoxin family protein [Anaerolineaceae bacterium]|nr:flavodoxin family protein [Anaerolineaceae bacterium]
MNVLLINGSPRPDGNCAYAVRHASNRFSMGGANVSILNLHDREIHPCVGCWDCNRGDCRFAADDMAEILDAMRWCGALILASPVYMGLITGQMKVMMDRSVPLRVRGNFEMSGKIGGGIACGGFRNGGQELTLQAMHTYFLQQDMLAAADGPNLSHSGAAIVGSAAEDRIGLITVDHLVDKILKELAARA